MENVPHWVWITMTGIMGLAWIIVTAINHSCKHEWTEPKEPRAVYSWSKDGKDYAKLPYMHIHTLVCAKCGRLKFVPEWPNGCK